MALMAEIIWSIVKNKSVFNLKESLGNLGVFIGNNFLKPLSLGWKYLLFGWFEQFQFFTFQIIYLLLFWHFLLLNLATIGIIV